MHSRTSNRMPPVEGVRCVDDVLRPTRGANGRRLYDVDRVLFFVHVMDVLDSLPGPIVIDISAAESKRVRQKLRRGHVA